MFMRQIIGTSLCLHVFKRTQRTPGQELVFQPQFIFTTTTHSNFLSETRPTSGLQIAQPEEIFNRHSKR